jgi:uncharacterized protein YaaR (DUF327 family)
MTQKILSRKEAASLGLTRYFSGKPCRNGHVAERYTKKSTCVQCDSERHLAKNLTTDELSRRNARQAKSKRAWRARRPEHNKAKSAEYRANECKEKKRQGMKAWRERNAEHLKSYKYANRERENARQREANAKNPEIAKRKRERYKLKNPERYKQVIKDWVERNIERLRERRSCYRLANKPRYAAHAANRRAMKLRATPGWACMRRIDFIYKEAARRGLTVDHIVPLQSDIVCGLHWHKNMQLLPMLENISKGNRHWPDMP